MPVSKTFFILFVLCAVNQCLGKPTTENDLSEGRGIMSSIWGWMSYPFYWWSSGELEKPVNEQLVGSTTTPPNDTIEIGNHNVTIWCNDQTCTTMKCDKTACRNITCNLYDTDLRGECREYNLIPDEEQTVPKTTQAGTTIPASEKPESHTKIPEISPSTINLSNVMDKNPIIEEHPLELEAVLSSTVNNTNTGENKKEGSNVEIKM